MNDTLVQPHFFSPLDATCERLVIGSKGLQRFPRPAQKPGKIVPAVRKIGLYRQNIAVSRYRFSDASGIAQGGRFRKTG
ncbi:MAG: hypothetical protein R3B94_06945 [Hyphomonas sp.]